MNAQPAPSDASEDGIVGLFSRDVIERGNALYRRDTEIYGGSTLKALAENIAFNYICEKAGVEWPAHPIGAQTYAAIKLMSLALILSNAKASPEILAEAICDLGILGRRASDEAAKLRRIAEDAQVAKAPEPAPPPSRPRSTPLPELVATEDDLEEAGSEAALLIRRLSQVPYRGGEPIVRMRE
jgi:hypothetical protein